jgi:hypothetical protein
MASVDNESKANRLVEQVRALSHLPPGTWIPQPPNQPDQEILAGLLRLPDEVDPIDWLIDAYRDFSAHVLLWTALSHLLVLIRDIRRAEQAGEEISTKSQKLWLGQLLELSEDIDLFQLLNDQPSTISKDLLLSTFWKLRELQQKSPRDSINRQTLDRFLVLLDELFQLQETGDPIQWIRDNRSRPAAIATLHHLLKQARPPRSIVVGGKVFQTHNLNIPFRANGLSVKLSRIALRNAGFNLSLRARIPERRLNIPAGLFSTGILWEEIEYIVDDSGYRYLVYERHEDHGKHLPFTYDFSLELVCYPAISPSAKEIVLSTSDTSFEIVSYWPGKYSPEVLHQVKLGDLTWRIKLADLEHSQKTIHR